jgi:hypothetical protein
MENGHLMPESEYLQFQRRRDAETGRRPAKPSRTAS